jgi:hypothetical protein
MRKLFIIPWFGKYPEWLDQWVANMEVLKKQGYDYLIFSNLKLFEQRVARTLGVTPIIKPGEGKVWDYRPMFGVIFKDEIKGYDYWGHTDFDCVYGDVNKYFPKEPFDIWSNHDTYLCGPWSLYKNDERVNNLFRENCWLNKISNPQPTGWAENEYTETINKLANVKYTLYQNKDFSDMSAINYSDGKLYDGQDEIMMVHFRRTKIYPLENYVI